MNYPASSDQVVASWDCAFKASKDSDFVAGQIWGRAGTNKYLLDRIHGRMDFSATLAAIRKLNSVWNPSATLVEDTANGPASYRHSRLRFLA